MGKDIVFLGLEDWDNVKQRPQYLVEGLSANHRIFYLNPVSYSFLTFFRRLAGQATQKRRLFSTQKTSHDLAPASFQIRARDNFFLLSPRVSFPFGMYSSTLNRWNHAALYRSFRHELPSDCILWTNFPLHLPFAENFPGAKVVYDRMDSYPDFYDGRRRALLRRMDEQLLKRADLVFASSPVLLEGCKRLSRRCFYLPNGVADCFFGGRSQVPPKDLPREAKLILTYIGAVDRWFNWAWIERLSKGIPGAHVLIIGPVRAGKGKAEYANVHYLGVKPHEEIVGYLDYTDVGLIPFRVNPLTHAANPIKMLEYFARGLPVVAPALETLANFSDHLFFVSNEETLVTTVERAAASGRSAVRKKVAEQFRWADLVERVEDLLPG